MQTETNPRSLLDAFGDGAEFYVGNSSCGCVPGVVDVSNTELLGSFDDFDSLFGIVHDSDSDRLVYMIPTSSCCWIYSPVSPEGFIEMLEGMAGL